METKNHIILTGEIIELPENERMVFIGKNRSSIKFKIKSYRKQKVTDTEQKYDEIYLYIFDQPDFLKNAKLGDRYFFEGELQRQNADKLEAVDEALQRAVDSYIKIMGVLPTNLTRPGYRIIWEDLFKYSLISHIPLDSKFGKNSQKTGNDYVYTVDEDGKVMKNKRMKRYEVVVHNYKYLSEPLNKQKGDINQVTILGLITKDVKFYPIINGYSTDMIISTELKYFTTDNCNPRFVKLPLFTTHPKRMDYIKNNIQKGDYIEIEGKFQTFKRTIESVRKKMGINGKVKKHKDSKAVQMGEVSISRIINHIKVRENDV